jgi:HSP20 family protein
MFSFDRSPPVFPVTLTDIPAQDSAQPLHSDRIAIGTTPVPNPLNHFVMEDGKMHEPTSRRSASPFHSLQRLNTMLDEAFWPWSNTQGDYGTITAAWAPACDVFEDAESVKIIAEIPGVNPEEVRLSMEGNVLTIRGEKKQRAEEKTERVHRYERSYGWFERAFSLPNTVDPDRIEAKVDQGVLTVELPKAERARPREIPVKTS